MSDVSSNYQHRVHSVATCPDSHTLAMLLPKDAYFFFFDSLFFFQFIVYLQQGREESQRGLVITEASLYKSSNKV